MNDFKIPAKYLIDFDTLKVGDRVWSFQEGAVTVIEVNENFIKAGKWHYTRAGLFDTNDQYPSLFRSNPFEDLREEFFKDTLMEVRDINREDWCKRVVLGKKNGIWLSWSNALTLEEAKEVMSITTWNQARPLPPPSEELVHLTLKDISEGKGVGVPAHLIRIKE